MEQMFERGESMELCTAEKTMQAILSQTGGFLVCFVFCFFFFPSVSADCFRVLFWFRLVCYCLEGFASPVGHPSSL